MIPSARPSMHAREFAVQITPPPSQPGQPGPQVSSSAQQHRVSQQELPAVHLPPLQQALQSLQRQALFLQPSSSANVNELAGARSATNNDDTVATLRGGAFGTARGEKAAAAETSATSARVTLIVPRRKGACSSTS